MKRLLLFPLLLLALFACSKEKPRVVVAYVTSWTKVIPEPSLMTHVNYAFGHVNDTFNGVRIDNPDRLRQMVELKKKNPSLHVLVSVGGWGSGRFSEMAADPANRKAFAQDCKRIVREYGLDGIDIDWEYPTSNTAGISSSPEDTKNFTLLMHDLRKALGRKRDLTLATVCSANYIDFPAILPYVNFVNVMAYDMASAPKHHAALHKSAISGWMTSSSAVEAHLKAGVPANRLVMGMPFYGRGTKEYGGYTDYGRMKQSPDFQECWDEEGCVPYLRNAAGNVVFGFDNPRSLKLKCEYILEQGLLGGMYWDYGGDNEQLDLSRTVWNTLNPTPKNK